MYEHKYKYGKQIEVKSFDEIRELVSKADLSNEEEAFFWILYYCGVRKSEAYERIVEDVKITKNFCVIDFHQRKKGSAKVPPLEIPRKWVGIDLIEKQVEDMRARKPRPKNIFFVEATGETRITPKGVERPVNKRTKKRVKAKWVFPHIQDTKAWTIVKGVLGKEFYPHFLRLNRITEICTDPTASLTRIKSFSGIKSTRVIDGYLGTSKKEQQKAIAFIGRQMEQENDSKIARANHSKY